MKNLVTIAAGFMAICMFLASLFFMFNIKSINTGILLQILGWVLLLVSKSFTEKSE